MSLRLSVSQSITNRLHYSHSDFNKTTKQKIGPQLCRTTAFALDRKTSLLARVCLCLDCHEFLSTPSHASMQTPGGRCSCTCSVLSTQPADSHHSPRVCRLSDSHCSAARRSGTAPGCHGHERTTRQKHCQTRVCRSTSSPAQLITGLPPVAGWRV